MLTENGNRKMMQSDMRYTLLLMLGVYASFDNQSNM